MASLLHENICSAKVVVCKSDVIPRNIEGEFIVVYDINKKTTTYYDSEELKKTPNKKISYEPESPQNHLSLCNSPNNIFGQNNYTYESIKNTFSQKSRLIDNRVMVTPGEITTFPYSAICRLVTTFPHPNPQLINVCTATGYELWDRLGATAGHCLLDNNGNYFQTLTAQFSYNNGASTYTMTQDDLSACILHGEFNGTNWRPEIDYAFLYWNRNIANYVGHFGISWSYSAGDTCLSAGYPSDLDSQQRFMYKSISTISSINNCVISSGNYCYQGQSGSPLYLPGGYAIGITSGESANAMLSVQLDNGITSWLSSNGYFN